MKQLLWITPRWPEPANDGAKIATLELLKMIQFEKGLEISILALIPDTEATSPIPDLKVRKIYHLKRSISKMHPIFRLLKNPFTPITFGSFMEEALEVEVKQIIQELDWDGIVFDGIHAALPFYQKGFPSNQKFSSRAHNAEFLLWERTSLLNTGLKKWALRFQAYLVKKFETFLIQNCEMTFPVSEEDATHFQKMVPSAKQEVIRIGQTFDSIAHASLSLSNLQANSHPIVVGFIGRLDWLPNQQGLEWFLKEVWPEVAATQPHLTLQIAGSGNSTWLKQYAHLPRIKLLGKLESLESFYQDIHLSLVPLFIGSGTRVKVIEASRYGIPCLSTALGVEGSKLKNNESYFHAETIAEWIQSLCTLHPERLREIGQSAFQKMKLNYDSKMIAEKMIRAILGDEI